MESLTIERENFCIDFAKKTIVVDGYKFNLPTDINPHYILSIKLSCDQKYAIFEQYYNNYYVVNMKSLQIIFGTQSKLDWNLEKNIIILKGNDSIKFLSIVDDKIKIEKHTFDLPASDYVTFCTEKNILVYGSYNTISLYDTFDPKPFKSITLPSSIVKTIFLKDSFICMTIVFDGTRDECGSKSQIFVYNYNLDLIYTIKGSVYYENFQNENITFYRKKYGQLPFTQYEKISFYLPCTKLKKMICLGLYENNLVCNDTFHSIWEFLVGSEIVLE